MIPAADGAATALGHGDPLDGPTGAVLDGCRRAEPDPRVRAALLVSSTACDPTNGRRWVGEALEDPSPAVRAAALFATARLGMPWTPATTRLPESVLTGGDPLPASEFWFHDLRWWLVAALACLDDDARRGVVGGLLASSEPSVPPFGVQAAEEFLLQARSSKARWEFLLRSGPATGGHPGAGTIRLT